MFFRPKKIHSSFVIAAFAACACMLGASFPAFAADPQTVVTASAMPQGELIASASTAKNQPSSSPSKEQSKQEKSRKTSGLTTPKQQLNTGNNKKNRLSASASQNAAESSKIKEQLDKFAKRKLALINQGLRPGKGSKEVTKQNGMFVARYIQVHPETLKTRFRSNTSNPPVRYVGFLQYQEMHYECRAETKEKALKGPFSIVRLRNMTEIIMYDNRGWHD